MIATSGKAESQRNRNERTGKQWSKTGLPSAMCISDTTRYPRLRKFALRGIKTTVEPRGVRALQPGNKKNRWPIVRPAIEFMVENRGFEPLTSWLPAMRSPS